MPWRQYCCFPAPPAGKLQSSLWPISARVPVGHLFKEVAGHLFKEVAVRFVHVYEVTDRSFFNP